MKFLCRLGAQLGKSLHEIVLGHPGPMSAWELGVWRDYYTGHGFDVDRIEGATALAGAAVAQTWGGKVRAHELVPQFGEARSDAAALATNKAFVEYMIAHGAQVEFVPDVRE